MHAMRPNNNSVANSCTYDRVVQWAHRIVAADARPLASGRVYTLYSRLYNRLGELCK